MSIERIELAAIKRAPDNKVFVGKSHADIFVARQCADLKGGKQGFITNEMRFVDRAEAAKIAFAAKQIDKERDMLMSENLTGDFPWLKDEMKQLRARLAELEGWVDDLQSGMYINCVYCGHRYGPEDKVPASMSEVLKKHVEQCPKHPMSALKSRLAELEEAHRWIPVEERLPEGEMRILGYGKDGYGDKIVAAISYNPEFKKFRVLTSVTHWKPIVLPKEKP